MRTTNLSVALTGRCQRRQLPRAEALGYSVLPFHGRSSRLGASQSFSDVVLQFRGDHLLEFHDVSREFADTLRQFLSGHRFLVERETERFLVE